MKLITIYTHWTFVPWFWSCQLHASVCHIMKFYNSIIHSISVIDKASPFNSVNKHVWFCGAQIRQSWRSVTSYNRCCCMHDAFLGSCPALVGMSWCTSLSLGTQCCLGCLVRSVCHDSQPTWEVWCVMWCCDSWWRVWCIVVLIKMYVIVCCTRTGELVYCVCIKLIPSLLYIVISWNDVRSEHVDCLHRPFRAHGEMRALNLHGHISSMVYFNAHDS